MTHYPIRKKIGGFKRRALRYYKLFKTPIKWFTFIITLAIGYKLIPVVILSNMKPPAMAVAVEEVREEDWAEEINSIGTIAAVQAVMISPEVGGTVVGIHFESGDKVHQGAKLITLNDAAEQADLARYKAQLEIAKLTLDRSKQLTSRKVESAAEYDQKKAKVDEAEALVAQATAVISKKNIEASFSGVLGIRQVNIGDYLQPGTPIVTLTNSDKLFINFNLPERYSHIVKTGQKIIFTVDAYGQEEFEGTITTVDPQISKDIRNLSIQASAVNRDNKLKSGMFANIRIILPKEDKSITVSESAIDYGLYGSAVYVVDQNEKKDFIVRKEFVKTGIYRKGRVAILSGVKAGERVVTAGQLKLNNGAMITISDDKGPPQPSSLPKP
ncbi:efflux RND transporter periplasmic adaptor subunit [Candidatus Odyssella thessalonicensis]|uniref:efflux RND transporter periplasmic adaptor subunit n=1 Tax=Candidatus Odyssella thessalonicensis TaxID=84647 RepID=UPI000225C145|nr:efflux RND transporter periplasmic adaptor subunit [Candidatus Odyssella thessalonicensis]